MLSITVPKGGTVFIDPLTVKLRLESGAPKEVLKMLDIYSIPATRLVNLMKAEKQLEEDDEAQDLIKQATREVGDEIGILERE